MHVNYTLPAPIRAAIWWNRAGIRGRGAVARAVGRMWRGGDFFIRTRHGAALSVDVGSLDVYATIQNNSGTWDAHVMTTCERLLRPNDVFYDIGSNTGIFAIDFAKVHAGLTAYAFEPQPSLAAHIRRSIEANGMSGITCLEMMLGAEDGEADLFLTSHSIHASIVPREHSFQKLRLPVRSLDSLVSAGTCKPPTLIKIDVEGAELQVFRGATRILHKHTPCVVFEADENMQRMGFSTQDLIDILLDAADYTFFLITPGGQLVPASAPYQMGNFLALPPRYSERIRDV